MTFGHAALPDFMLEPGLTYLNHGTVGVAHRAVFDARTELLREIESDPARFQLRELADPEMRGQRSRLAEAMTAVAPFVGAAPADTVFVDNITTGANAILRSFPFRPGDEVLVTDYGYGGVTNAARYAAGERGATLRTAPMPWPVHSADQVAGAVIGALTPATRMLVIDHVTASTALILPLAEIAQACHGRGVLVLADGAHAPGSAPLDIASLGVDWYVANLHKWAFAPRSTGFLWCAPEHQPVLHSAVISWGLGNGFAAEFHLPGTRDATPALIAPFALEVMRGYGLGALWRYNHDTVWAAANTLAERWDVPLTTPEAMIGAMATIALPPAAGETAGGAVRLQRHLRDTHRIEAPLACRDGRLYVRLSCQIYNEAADYDRLGAAVDAAVGASAGTPAGADLAAT